jgi:hypothetical protein
LGKERSKIKKGSKDPKIGTEEDKDWDWSRLDKGGPGLGQKWTKIFLELPKIVTGADQDWVRSGRRLRLELPKIVTGADQDWTEAAQDRDSSGP